MAEKTVKTICQVMKYAHDCTHRITVKKKIMEDLQLQTGDFVEVTFKKILRPEVND